MSPLFSSVEVLNGPTVGINKETSFKTEQERKTEDFVLLGRKSLNSCYSFVTKEEEEEEEEEKQEAEESSESSSIGVQSSSSSEDDDDERGIEVQSKLKEEGALSSLDSLEDSLPIKRGLSNFFTGKSKSFASLSDAASGDSSKDLAKQENPFNKRRRILMANKISWGRRASYSSLITSLPSLLTPDFVVKEGEEEENERVEGDSPMAPPLPNPHSHGGGRGLSQTFKSPRSFSLSDLQHV